MDWKKELSKNVTTVDQLAKVFAMSGQEKKRMKEIIELWPMSISRYYLGLIDHFDSSDPIFKMCIPQVVESDLEDGILDTSGEKDNTKEDGLQHKYEKTALILSTQCCAMYCRHCFRKRLVGLNDNEIAREDERIFEYIASHPEINNVLISGGDSFLVDNSRIEAILERLASMPNVRFVRFGTRTPVTFPERITSDEGLLEVLSKYREKMGIHVVTQFNHPKEITPQSIAAISALQERRITVSNQTVMLREINDDPVILTELIHRLTENDIVPYYVFQCRPVKGVKQQFQVPIMRSFQVIEATKKNLSGLGKRFRYIMSHKTGKIEIFSVDKDGNGILKYHQAKNYEDIGRVFTHKFSPEDCWLD